MENLSTTISLVLALSLSAERLVEIVKGFIKPLNIKGNDEQSEAHRKAWVAILAILCGVTTSLIFYFAVPNNGVINNVVSAVAYGILASGGSAFWNSILSYILGVKDLKTKEAEAKKLENKILSDDVVIANVKKRIADKFSNIP